jgi:hypothetical protein
LPALGYRAAGGQGDELVVARARRRRSTPAEPMRPRRVPGDGHPFAKLSELNLA